MKTTAPFTSDAAVRRPAATADAARRVGVAAVSPFAAQRSEADRLRDSPRIAQQRAQLVAAFGPALQRQAARDHAALMMKAMPGVVQRQAPEDEELLQGRFVPVQKQAAEEEEELQTKQTPSAAARLPRGVGSDTTETGLPPRLKSGIESLSGVAMDRVKVHYGSSQPAQLNALAYARGNDIHVAPGQERHLPHEAWHVVQQAQGRVQPTMQLKDGVPVNDDEGLEREADVMGARALAHPERLPVTGSDSHAADTAAVAGTPLRLRTSQQAAGAPDRPIQRFPTRDSIVGRLKEPKRRSSKYKAVLQAVDDYNNYARTTHVQRDSAAAQFHLLMNALSDIETAARAYTGKTSAKATYMLQTLLPQVVSERALAAQTLLKVVTGGFAHIGGPQTLANAMLMSVGSAKSLSFSQANAVGADRGGMSEVTKFNLPGNQAGFFKENKATLTNLSGGPQAEVDLLERLGRELTPDDAAMKFNALKSEYDLGVIMVGIDANDARMSNRDVAMSRIDTLLGANVIARAQLAVRSSPNAAAQHGSIMWEAQGKQAAKLMGKGRFAPDGAQKALLGPKAVNQQDPALMRLLSKLQLIDLLCMQVDRNPKNFYIQTDANGNVTGITGIDNDLSLGTTTGIDKRKQELPGLSRYVDKELAEKIMHLDLSLLRLILVDLLSPAEINALVTRFTTVQSHLRAHETQLLRPQEWTAAVALGLTDESKSYWADLDFNKRKYGPGQ